ncbi:uncharacterized protein LOC103103694 isoform X11 [Monodelphis domestica]|nr:uncharacterized protein LOC103103694 isoform X11 [Monodelphis domestica]
MSLYGLPEKGAGGAGAGQSAAKAGVAAHVSRGKPISGQGPALRPLGKRKSGLLCRRCCSACASALCNSPPLALPLPRVGPGWLRAAPRDWVGCSLCPEGLARGFVIGLLPGKRRQRALPHGIPVPAQPAEEPEGWPLGAPAPQPRTSSSQTFFDLLFSARGIPMDSRVKGPKKLLS